MSEAVLLGDVPVEVEIADLCERYRAIWWDTETREVVYPAVDDAA